MVAIKSKDLYTCFHKVTIGVKMSFLDGKIGNRRNTLLRVRLTPEEESKLENMAASYNMDKSELVRQRLFGRTADYIKSEISNAIAKVKNGYQRTTQGVKSYFTDPEDAYLPAYAPAAYITNPGYR